MPLVNQTVPGLFNGVSEQPPEVRLDTQTELMINCNPSLVAGVQRRQGAKIEVAELDVPANVFTHVYDRGAGDEEYIIYIWSGNWAVYADDGSLVDSGTDPYLNIHEGADPKRSFALNTAGDTTYIVNKTKVTEDLVALEEEPEFYSYSFSCNEFKLMTKPIQESGIYPKTYDYLHVGLTVGVKYNGIWYDTASPIDHIYNGPESIQLYGSGVHHQRREVKDQIVIGLREVLETIRLSAATVLEGTDLTLTHPTSGTVSFETRVTVGPASNGNEYWSPTHTSGVEWLGDTWRDNIIPYPIPVTGSMPVWSALTDIGSPWERTFYYWVKRTAGGSDSTNQPLRYTYSITDGVSGSSVASIITHDSKAAASYLSTNVSRGESSGSVMRAIDVDYKGSDSWGDQASESWTGRIKKLSDLPTKLGFEDAIIEVTGDDETGFTNFYVKYNDGAYNEIAHPSQPGVLRPETMPHALIRGQASTPLFDIATAYSIGDRVSYNLDIYKFTVAHAADTSWDHEEVEGVAPYIQFYFTALDKSDDNPLRDGRDVSVLSTNGDPLVDSDNMYITEKRIILSEGWGVRKAGDNQSAPLPGFVGQPITDIFFYKNRLGLISGSNVTLSASGAYYDFFPSTVTDVLDSDPVDVAVDSNQVVKLEYAIPFAKELLLFGGNAQFAMSSTKTLSPKDVSVQQTTAFELNAAAKPVALGPNIYFTMGSEGSSHSSKVREYYVVQDTASNDAVDITSHCPHFIPGGITKLVGCPNHDMLFAITPIEVDKPTYIYVYNYMWQGEEKSQSAWHKWEVSGIIHNIEIFNNKLSIILEEDDTVVHKSISLNTFKNMSYIPADTYLDETTGVDSYTYESRIGLSKWGVPVGQLSKTDNQRLRLSLRDTKFSVSEGSKYNLEVTKKGNDKPKTYSYVPDNKFSTMGDVNNIQLAVTSKDSEGFQIFSMNYRGSVSNTSKAL